MVLATDKNYKMAVTLVFIAFWILHADNTPAIDKVCASMVWNGIANLVGWFQKKLDNLLAA